MKKRKKFLHFYLKKKIWNKLKFFSSLMKTLYLVSSQWIAARTPSVMTRFECIDVPIPFFFLRLHQSICSSSTKDEFIRRDAA